MNNKTAIITEKNPATSGRHNSIHNLSISVTLILHTYNVMFGEGYTANEKNRNVALNHLFFLFEHFYTHTNTHLDSNPADALPHFPACHSTAETPQQCFDAFSIRSRPPLTRSDTASASAGCPLNNS